MLLVDKSPILFWLLRVGSKPEGQGVQNQILGRVRGPKRTNIIIAVVAAAAAAAAATATAVVVVHSLFRRHVQRSTYLSPVCELADM